MKPWIATAALGPSSLPPIEARGGLPQRRPGALRVVAQHVQALRADAARGQVHDTLEGGIVVAVGNQAQVRERVLDLGALEEAQAAVDPVRHARGQERLFQHPRLRVGAVQDRELAPQAALRDTLADAVMTNSASSRSLKAV